MDNDTVDSEDYERRQEMFKAFLNRHQVRGATRTTRRAGRRAVARRRRAPNARASACHVLRTA